MSVIPLYHTAIIITIKKGFVWLFQQSLSSAMMARCLLTPPHLCGCSCTTGSGNVSSWSNQQRHKSVSNSTPTSSTKAVSDDDAIEPNFPTVWNTDISQIKYSWQELNWSSWVTGTLIESIAGFLNAARGTEAGSADPKWSWLWPLSSWEMRWVNTALNKTNGLRHFNPRENDEETERDRQRIRSRDKGRCRQWRRRTRSVKWTVKRLCRQLRASERQEMQKHFLGSSKRQMNRKLSRVQAQEKNKQSITIKSPTSSTTNRGWTHLISQLISFNQSPNRFLFKCGCLFLLLV